MGCDLKASLANFGAAEINEAKRGQIALEMERVKAILLRSAMVAKSALAR